MRRHGAALGYPSILAPIVLAMFSARVVKAKCAETRAAQTNRSANDITATNAASSGASMISSIGFLTRSSNEELGASQRLTCNAARKQESTRQIKKFP